MAEPYWSGHFNDLFGGVGGVGSNVSTSVSGRIQGGDSTHKLVLYARVLLAGGVMTFACWGWWRRRDHKYRERSLLVLTFVLSMLTFVTGRTNILFGLVHLVVFAVFVFLVFVP